MKPSHNTPLYIFLSTIVFIAVAYLLCNITRITDGYIGIKQTFTGEIVDKSVAQGLHLTPFSTVTPVSVRNIIRDIDATPMVSEKIPMNTFKIKVSYNVLAEKAPYIYKTEKLQHITTEDGDIFLMAKYVDYIAKAAVNDVIANYKALSVNDNRSKIESEIKAAIIAKLLSANKADYLAINEVNIIDIKPPQSVINSSIAIVNSQNALQTKINEVEVAKQESIRMSELAKQADSNYVNLLNAQAQKVKADALMVAAQKGSVNVWVIPDDITSVGNLSK